MINKNIIKMCNNCNNSIKCKECIMYWTYKLNIIEQNHNTLVKGNMLTSKILTTIAPFIIVFDILILYIDFVNKSYIAMFGVFCGLFLVVWSQIRLRKSYEELQDSYDACIKIKDTYLKR